MTVEEAMRIIDRQADLSEALRIIRAALESDMPRTPLQDAWGWNCPACGGSRVYDDENYAYCPDCGQAIDWGSKP